MYAPQFIVAVLGRFHTLKAPSAYAEKPITIYEMEFYTEDYPGGTVTNGVFRPAVKGGFCIFKPGQMQRLVPPYRCYVLNISTQDPHLKSRLDALPTFSMLPNMDEAVRLLRLMLAIEDRKSLENQLRMHSYAGQILTLLLDNNRLEQKDSTVLRHRQVLLDADRYIREHLDEDLCLNRLARQSNLDPTYFHKLFTAAFGTTPAKQVENYRIAAVKEGLLEETASIELLAQRYGFSSASYLGAKFRQATGMTPTQYRKSILQKKITLR